jgi:hypothetical protein
MIKTFLAASVAASTLAAPAFAGGLEGSYAGAGGTIGTNGTGVAGSILGRVDTKQLGSGVPISVRPGVTINNEFGGNLGVSGDFAVAPNVNIYAGGGAGFGSGTALNGSDDVVGYLTLGVEGEVAKNVVIFTDFKLGLGSDNTTYVPTVGVAYRF